MIKLKRRLSKCGCGCGKQVRVSTNRFIHGHANKGKKRSEEIKARISKAHLGNKQSEETKAKISKAHKGKMLSEKHKAKIGKANKGKKMSEWCKAQIFKANKGRKASEEHKAKIAIALMKPRIDGYCHIWGDPEYVNDCRKDVCEECGLTNALSLKLYDRKLDTHHMNGKKECAPEDIQTLCVSCHAKLHWKEKRRRG